MSQFLMALQILLLRTKNVTINWGANFLKIEVEKKQSSDGLYLKYNTLNIKDKVFALSVSYGNQILHRFFFFFL